MTKPPALVTMEDANCGAADNPARVRKIIEAVSVLRIHRAKLSQASAVGYSMVADRSVGSFSLLTH